MQYFQIVTFLLEALFYLGIITYGLIKIYCIINSYEKERNSTGEKAKATIPYLALIIFFGYLLIPFMKDIPTLFTENYYITFGKPSMVKSGGSKDLYKYVYYGNTKLNVFLDTDIDTKYAYDIKYLPNSKRIIYAEKSDKSLPQEQRKVKFPIGSVLSIVYVLLVIFILNRFAFWFFGIICTIYFPVSIYQFFKQGMSSNLWWSKDNEGLVMILFGIFSLLMVFISFWIEKRYHNRGSKSKYLSRYKGEFESFITMVFAHILTYALGLSLFSLFDII